MSDTQVMYRWDNHQDDMDVYDEMFTEALTMISGDSKTVGKLILMIINDWEKNRRSVSMPVINAAYEVVQERQQRRNLAEQVNAVFIEPEA